MLHIVLVTTMYLEAQILTLLCGISLVNGFFHFKRKDYLFKHEQQSFNKSILQNDPTHWIEQQVDHFNNTDHRTWRQKYYKEMHSWKPEGPIVLYLNGEGALKLATLQSIYWDGYGGESQSLVGQIVVETGAALFMLEHRYYGESQPFDKPTVKDLAFLQSRQALADAAHLLRTIKQTSEFQKSKVIVVGGSYAGNLAAWMKLMYPDLVDAALASSAPVLAKKDFYEYFEAVTDTFRTYGSQECVDEITERFNTEMKEEYSACKDLDTINTYAYAAQYETPSEIILICREVKNCSNFEFNTQLEPWSDHQMWIYQTCTEFGYFQTTSSSKQMFGNYIELDVYIHQCKSNFGGEFNEERVDQAVLDTNRMYGGLTPNVTNVVFVNGDMDPWHRLGVLQDLSADAPAIFIKGSSHCHDLLQPDPSDTDNIKEARKRIKILLKQWIGQV